MWGFNKIEDNEQKKRQKDVQKVQDDRPKFFDSVIGKGDLQRNLDKHPQLILFAPIQLLFSSCLTEAFDIDMDRMQMIQTIIADCMADAPR